MNCLYCMASYTNNLLMNRSDNSDSNVNTDRSAQENAYQSTKGDDYHTLEDYTNHVISTSQPFSESGRFNGLYNNTGMHVRTYMCIYVSIVSFYTALVVTFVLKYQ